MNEFREAKSMLELNEKAAPEPSERNFMPFILGGAFLLLAGLVGGIAWWNNYSQTQAAIARTAGIVRAGTPEFDAYLRDKKIVIDKIERWEAEGNLGWRYDIQCEVKNVGDRTLTGIEMRAFVVDFDEKPLGERIFYPMATQKVATLAPGQTLPIRISVDGIRDSGSVMDVRIAVRGARFK